MNVDLSKYKNNTPEDIIGSVIGGGDIIGQEVDENNHLWYVIKNDDDLSVADAESVQVTLDLGNIMARRRAQQVASRNSSISNETEQNNSAN